MLMTSFAQTKDHGKTELSIEAAGSASHSLWWADTIVNDLVRFQGQMFISEATNV